MLLEPQANNRKILLIIVTLILLGGIVLLVWQKYSSEPSPVACTLEAKLCPDGSAVGRTGPKCEFAECPVEKTDPRKEAIREYLLTQKEFSWKTTENSQNVCAIEIFSEENNLFPLFVWANCGEYIWVDNQTKLVSGFSGRIKINYPNELSFFDLSKFSHEAPRDGSFQDEDIERIFPAEINQKISLFQQQGGMESLTQEREALALKSFGVTTE